VPAFHSDHELILIYAENFLAPEPFMVVSVLTEAEFKGLPPEQRAGAFFCSLAVSIDDKLVRVEDLRKSSRATCCLLHALA
jgi:hypothetical protein